MKTIAVIEDNPDNRLIVATLLADLYHITEYETGPEALAGMEQAPPDLVLLDISLPGMDGTEVLDRIRASPTLHRLPVIALTAHAMAGDREHFLARGFNRYLTKPILEETALLEAIHSCLDRGD